MAAAILPPSTVVTLAVVFSSSAWCRNARAKARGLSEKDYMSGNLLGREVTAEDVAQAFLHQALALKTTADVTTVDGGNIAAAMR